MTITKFKFGKKKKPAEPVNEYVIDDVAYLRRPSFLSQPPVRTPPDSLGEDAGENTHLGEVENEFEPKPNFPIEAVPWKRHKLFTTPFPRYRHLALSVSLEKNEIFVMGGLKDGSVFGDTWKIVPQISPLGVSIDGFVAQHVEVTNNNNPPARVGHSSILCGNAYIIYGGDTVDTDYQGFPDDNFYMFNINNCKYTVPLHILNKPKGRYGHLIGVVLMNTSSSRLYLFGGQLENDVYNDMYYFELNSFKLPKARWEIVEPLNNSKPPPLTNHTMCVHKHKVYIFGGIYNNEKVSNDLWCFDTLVNKWLQIQTSGDLPKPVNEHSACIVSDILYVYGGNDFSGTIYDTLYALDLKSFSWSKLSKELEKDGPGARCGHTMSFIPKLNKLIVMGGDKNDYVNPSRNDYETYEESNGQDAGTMIYELDLTTANHYMNTLRPQKRAASAGGAAGLVSRRAASPLPSEDAYTRHRRSLSNNLDDYKTPNGSLDHLARSLDPKVDSKAQKFEDNGYDDKFVEVPSSAVSAQVNLDDQSNAEEPFSHGKYREDRLSPLQDDLDDTPDFRRAANNDTPILTRDFAHLSDAAYEETEPVPIVSHKSKAMYSNGEIKDRVSSDSSEKMNELQSLINDLKNKVEHLEAEKSEENERSQLEIADLKMQISNSRTEAANLEAVHDKELSEREKQIKDQEALLLELKTALGPEALNTSTASDTLPVKGITELTRFKLLSLDLQNQLTHVTYENLNLKEKQARFEPFMNNQIEELSSLQKIIKAQEERIGFLTTQIKLELVLLEQIATLKHEKEDLQMQFDNYKVLNAPLDVSDEEDDEDELGEGSPRKDFSGQLSTKLSDLVSLWQVSSLRNSANTREISDNEVVSQLQKQVEELSAMVDSQQKLSASEVEELQGELATTAASLKVFETNYRDAMQAAKRTGDALDLTRDELQLKKTTIEKLLKEIDELKLYTKSGPKSADNDSAGAEDFNNQDVHNGVAAHFNMKMKEMEAEIFVMKNENENLASQVSTLKKELYMAKNQS
ncbi:hypothetical protein PUMCH_004772 [Australozyma saopauloensis]|uniref:Uncharacterized protein n=1 Tax=Australozyma saopauloensis TaxID=291208 RepID=A0AAX4HFL1_9ASCO|nr:hypothetical protein PUMCH_004772 [[Candida] saopauloensis]